MGSIHTGLEEVKGGFEKLAAFYEARAKGGVGLIVTGGIAPNRRGWLKPFSARMTKSKHAKAHSIIPERVHEYGGKICMQILHAGRYGYHPFSVAPSAIKSPISPFKPSKLSSKGVNGVIKDFANSAYLAREAGYDGIEIMGSEGYLINQFLVEHTNIRSDEWGGSFENRMRFPLEIIKQVRKAVGQDFILIYRLSMLDLIPKGSSWDEIVTLAKRVEEEGVNLINTGIGWHEARVPTIATMVPRGSFSWVTKKMKGEVNIPLVTTNRINTPEKAEQILTEGHADMVSMARPFLADADFMQKSEKGSSNEINTCIACNQACLDHVFKNKLASCLVNPLACRETEFTIRQVDKLKNIAVVGAGPAGLSFAVTAAEIGHQVTLYEQSDKIGGQFNMAKTIPGKEEFYETLRYYQAMLDKYKVKVHLNKGARLEELKNKYDHVVMATGVEPRDPAIAGQNHPSVLSYIDVLKDKKEVGEVVAIVGAGGIGFDVAEFLIHGSETPDVDHFLSEWGVDKKLITRGGIKEPEIPRPQRKIFLLQRKKSKMGSGLGKTTGWIHRAVLKNRNVEMISGVSYEKIDDQGLHIKVNNKGRILNVDNIVLCAGQVSNTGLAEQLSQEGIPYTLIGGSKFAGELDAKRAINEGFELAFEI